MSRSTRSASIPIPRNSSNAEPASRDIESFLSLALTSQSRPRVTGTQSAVHRAAGLSRTPDAPRYVGSEAQRHVAGSLSSVPPTYRAASINNARQASTSAPRVIRGSVDSPRGPAPWRSSQAKRINGLTPQSPSSKTCSPGHEISARSTYSSPCPRPSYLEHSALRHILLGDPTSLDPRLRPSEQTPTYTHRYLTALCSSTENDAGGKTHSKTSNNSSAESAVVSNPILRIPTRWSEQDRNINLSVSFDGREVTYNGTAGNGLNDGGSVRTNNYMPPACGIYYFEVDIINKDESTRISVGFSTTGVTLSRLPGSESSSWGYQDQNGLSHASHNSGSPQVPVYGVGDTVGCGVDFTTYKAFFTLNGSFIASVFDDVGRDANLYPSVGLQHVGDAIRVNFGHEPFKYDIDYHVQQQQSVTWAKIVDTPLQKSLLYRLQPDSILPSTPEIGDGVLSDEGQKDVLNSLVMSYLVHNGYSDTVNAFQKQQINERSIKTLSSTSGADDKMDTDVSPRTEIESQGSVVQDMDRRAKIVNAIASGNIDAAIADAQAYFPKVLLHEDGLVMFKLRCRKFVELFLETTELKKAANNGNRSAAIDEDSSKDASVPWTPDDGMATDMDIDDDSMGDSPSPSFSDSLTSPTNRIGTVNEGGKCTMTSSLAQYEKSLNKAISYGQALTNDYKRDTRPEVQQLFNKTFGIIAWEDPLHATSSVAEIVGNGARLALANDLNQAILKSQGKPIVTALETIYKHTGACVSQLGILGVGAAAFADMSREFAGSSSY